ncbi:MAG: hypothetical protein AB2392_05380 [Neobacillus sp.]|jgi:hypothetical protein
MVRIHNPVKSSNKQKLGADNQLHGGMMENVDQIADLITKAATKESENPKTNK